MSKDKIAFAPGGCLVFRERCRDLLTDEFLKEVASHYDRFRRNFPGNDRISL
jgi:hypothetical protein